MQTKDGDVVVLVMPGVSVVYLGPVMKDGEGLDVIKERFIVAPALKGLAEARALARQTGGRVLRWMRDETEPHLWVGPENPTAKHR